MGIVSTQSMAMSYMFEILGGQNKLVETTT